MSWFPWTRESKQLIDRTRSLESVPMLNEGVETEQGEGGRLVVTVTLKRNRTGWAGLLSPKAFTRHIKLDELGTFTFRLIDGTRTVRDIIDLFQKQYKVNRREAELSCVEFMKLLASRQVISIVIK